MKIYSLIDYLGYNLLKLVGPLMRSLPKKLVLFLGRSYGDILYCFDLKHRAIAYANIKTAFSNSLTPQELTGLTRKFYRSFGQNLIEVFLVPLVNKKYVDRYITVDGLDNVREGLKKGKGVILLGVHNGSWEIVNVIWAILEFPFVVFVRDQGYPRLNNLLNSYRRKGGCQLVTRHNGARELIEALKNNQLMAITADQGGKAGMLVDFFGKQASMAQGAIRLALKYDAVLLAGYSVREKGSHLRVMIEGPFQVKKSGDLQQDIHDNLQELARKFERYILKYPREYLWTYKIWKYAQERNILIINDGKAGHLRQSQAIAKVLSSYLKDKGLDSRVETIEVTHKNKLSQSLLTLGACLADKYSCQGCFWCLRLGLKDSSYGSLLKTNPDIVISAGASLAPVNYIIAKTNLAKSIVVMRPALLNSERFDLVVMPRHDNGYPKARNVVVADGALNLVNDDYLRQQADALARRYGLSTAGLYIGLLIGGDSKNFRLDKNVVFELIKQLKSICEVRNLNILVTTSRRTSREIEGLLKGHLTNYPRCKLLVIANEKNIPEAVGGILGLSKIVIVSPESISMISEAASSGRYALVFKSQVGLKHQRFLDNMAQKKYIYLTEADRLGSGIDELLQQKPHINILNDLAIVRQGLERLGF